VATQKSGKSRLGELLISAGNLSAEQLESALERQKTQKLPLGQLLVKLGFISDDAMRMALASQVGVPFIDLDNTSIDPGLGRVLNKNFARRHVLVPVGAAGPHAHDRDGRSDQAHSGGRHHAHDRSSPSPSSRRRTWAFSAR
jgi:hypothetical protein